MKDSHGNHGAHDAGDVSAAHGHSTDSGAARPHHGGAHAPVNAARSGGHHEHAHDHHAMPGSAHPNHDGHDKHAGHSVAMFRDKFWISLVLTVPTLIWGHMLQDAFGYTAPHFPGSMYI